MNQFLDIARGAYSRLPPQTRSTLASFLRFVPENLKWGSSYREWRALLTAARDHPAIVREHQDRARLAMVTAAARHSRYYRALFEGEFGAGFKPEHLLDDAYWTRIPVLTSASVVAHAHDMCTRPPEELDTGSTGGSSGKPVKFYLDRNRSPIEYAFVHDTWSRAGFRAGDPRCVFRGVELSNADETHMSTTRRLPNCAARCFTWWTQPCGATTTKSSTAASASSTAIRQRWQSSLRFSCAPASRPCRKSAAFF